MGIPRWSTTRHQKTGSFKTRKQHRAHEKRQKRGPKTTFQVGAPQPELGREGSNEVSSEVSTPAYQGLNMFFFLTISLSLSLCLCHNNPLISEIPKENILCSMLKAWGELLHIRLRSTSCTFGTFLAYVQIDSASLWSGFRVCWTYILYSIYRPVNIPRWPQTGLLDLASRPFHIVVEVGSTHKLI